VTDDVDKDNDIEPFDFWSFLNRLLSIIVVVQDTKLSNQLTYWTQLDKFLCLQAFHHVQLFVLISPRCFI
jgi:hypothetical protein